MPPTQVCMRTSRRKRKSRADRPRSWNRAMCSSRTHRPRLPAAQTIWYRRSIVYRVNGGDYRTLADNLSTGKNYTLAASSVALGLAANERVTEVMFVFGQAPAGFAQVESPYLYCKAVAGLPAGSFVNVADVGGTYNGTWVQAVSRWVISVYGKPTVPKLPRTGY